jgi:glycosyltransferase involved in cell wall biosynthesis
MSIDSSNTKESKVIRVLVVPSDRFGVGYFRSVTPHLALESQYPDEFKVDIDYEPQLNNDEWLKQYDIIHYHRNLGPFEEMETLLSRLKTLGIVAIMDIDDYWSPGNHHPAYEIIKQQQLDKKTYNNIKLAQYITTTTDIFAKEISNTNKNVFVIPNTVDSTDSQFISNPEPSDRLRIGWLGGSCLKPDTEILTDNGWVLISKLTRDEKVATLNPKTNEIEYHKPTGYIEEPFKGSMHNCNTRDINFSVTPNHNMFISEHRKIDYKLIKAEDMGDKDWYFQKNGINTNTDVEYYQIPNAKNKLNMNDFIKLFGLYITEGWCKNENEINIWLHSNESDYKEIIDILVNNNISYVRQKNKINITNETLYKYFKEFGNFTERYIPRILLDTLSKKQTLILLEWILKSDLSNKKALNTTSKRLSDDLMELAFKAGYSAIVKKSIKNKTSPYQIQFNTKYLNLKPLVKNKHITKEKYDGLVYCVEVQNNIIYVRRNGKSMWIGNSHLKDLEILNKLVNKLNNCGMMEKLQFVLCGFDLRGTHTEIDRNTGEQRVRNILPKESVWYQYERIFTDDYKTVSKDYYKFLNKFVNEEYPDVKNEAYRRVWTKNVSKYANNYNLFDVSIVPLEENTFNKCKSELKIIESGYHKKAMIIQNFGPYTINTKNILGFNGAINEDGNVILIDSKKNDKDWFNAIKKLINNPELIPLLANNLNKMVNEKYSLTIITEKRKYLYKKLLNKN